LKIINSVNFPVQVIWAGKPYPQDQDGITLFNRIRSLTEMLPNCAVLIGYELELSALLKRGSDIWLNTPRMYHEASGTSGMSAAMNCSVNVSIPDGWIPEFAHDTKNCFIIKPAGSVNYTEQNDHEEAHNMLDLLEHTVIPKYYESASEWLKIIKKAALDISVDFDSERMVNQYTYLLYDTFEQD
jgi:glycogen phosphorylase